MFTGIVEETGTVERITRTGETIELEIGLSLCADGLNLGDSLAVNGCCLTVVELKADGDRYRARFDLLEETWRLTNLQHTKVGSLVNLERALAAGGRFGGHFVTGHIDGLGKITRWEQDGQNFVLEVEPPAELMRYLIRKGSVAIDGISLTVADVMENGFRLWIIPHTQEVTNLKHRQPGDFVNVECDMLGKYVERILEARGQS